MAAGCGRLVHPCVAAAGERRAQRRFIGLMMAAPFLVGGAAVTLSAVRLGVDMALAGIFAAFGVCWFTGLLASASGSLAVPGRIALIAGSLGLACLVALAGGLASPVVLLALALPVETAWVSGSRRATVWAAGAAAAALVLQYALEPVFPAAIPAAWHWLLPLAWGLTLAPRLGDFAAVSGVEETEEARLEDVIDGVVLRLARAGDVVEASARTQSLLGLAPALLAGTGLFDRIHIADRVPYLSALADLRDGASRQRLSLRLRMPRSGADDPGDRYRPFDLELMRSGETDCFIGLLRDGGEAQGLREELEAAREAAAGADIAKGRFLAAVSHELRTPLNAIIGFSDMLLHEMFGPFKDPRQKEYVELVRESGQHLLEVVTSILDVSRIEAGTYGVQPEPFHFSDAVDMCQSLMRLQAETKGVVLEARVADTGEINADRRAVQQILINLVSNAVKFTPGGGHVAIGAQRVGSRLHFWVSDTGIGIEEKDFANLGKPFMQIQNDYTRRFEGTGLGLSLVKGLVALHEGTMSIESAPGEGTKVSISLPLDGPKQGSDKPVVLLMPSARASKGEADGAFRKTA